MSFLRPEALAAITRWREVGAALAAGALGAWIATRGGYFYGALGGLILAFGLGLALAAWRTLRFARADVAPGVVQIDEGAIAYFGPEIGGVVALSELSRIDVLATSDGPSWRLSHDDGRAVTIPAAATGAEALINTFAALPGASLPTFLDALDHPPEGARTLWRRDGASAGPALTHSAPPSPRP